MSLDMLAHLASAAGEQALTEAAAPARAPVLMRAWSSGW